MPDEAPALDPVEEAMVRLARAMEENPLPPDPFAVWRNAHPEELTKYPGERVLLHPVRGVLAHGTYDMVLGAEEKLTPLRKDKR